ncbi:MAG: type II toxin-antitoxin system RelE/ParE family toxin [Sideroxydans sp.]|nr:type II toxin-antitoxin system RelE/ParE family toxin [Sideroxydans sp.]
MQHVVWLETASQDLDQILGYIEERNLLAALDLQESIEYAASQLPFHPYLYRLGRVPGTRELVVHPNYLVIYRVTVSSIEIINVLHARQQYPA